VNCSNCHTNRIKNPKMKFIFSSVKEDCESCHKDIHFGQFKDNGKTVCQNCHSFNNWLAEKFNHEKTKFSLKGSHEKLPCSACHKQQSNGKKRFVKFKLESFTCAACHS